jgi:uncharacterized peroxidase-related enzyme
MTFIPDLDEHDHLLHVLARFPRGLKPLFELHDAILRDESELSVGERETIAAIVSARNACQYCYGAHKDVAGRFGVDGELVEALMKDLDTAPVDDKFRVLLQYVGKLTTAPASLTQQDADAVYAAGWSPDALYDAVAVCALFNFMNRIVEGTGVKPVPEEIRATMPRPPKDMTYSDLWDMMGQFRK